MILLLSLSLAMDAFAVAISCGASGITRRWAIQLAIYFGVFQAGMAAIGALFGSKMSGHVGYIGQIIAFVILSVIGGRMILAALRSGIDATPKTLTHRRAVALAIATSIDALAAGVSLAFLPIHRVVAVCAIGVAAFSLTLVGTLFGHQVGKYANKRAELVGGVVLIALGIRGLIV